MKKICFFTSLFTAFIVGCSEKNQSSLQLETPIENTSTIVDNGITFDKLDTLEMHTIEQHAFASLKVEDPLNNPDTYMNALIELKVDGSKNLSHPKINKLTFKLNSNIDNNATYKFKISLNSDLSNCVEYENLSTQLDIYNLYSNKKYYYQIIAEDDGIETYSNIHYFKTEELCPRIIQIDGVSNCRDLGGYQTQYNCKTKQGMIYRTAKLDHITPQGKADSKSLNFKTEINFRKQGYENEEYIGKSPLNEDNTCLPNLNYINIPITNFESQNDILKESFKIFGDIKNYPIVFHCSAGADRTGWVGFFLNALLGVSEDVLIKDYVFTSFKGIRQASTAIRYLKNYLYMPKYNIDNKNNISKCAESFLLDRGVDVKDIENVKKIMLDE